MGELLVTTDMDVKVEPNWLCSVHISRIDSSFTSVLLLYDWLVMLFVRDVWCVWGRFAPFDIHFLAVSGVRSVHCFHMYYILWLQHKVLGCINDVLIILVSVCDPCLRVNYKLIHSWLLPLPNKAVYQFYCEASYREELPAFVSCYCHSIWMSRL